jgi:PKD domain/Secretion system C-terminal sorting domain
MKKVKITLLLLIATIVASYAQIPFKTNIQANIKRAELVKYKQQRFKKIDNSHKTNGTKSTPTSTYYIDWDALSQYYTANTTGYVWQFNSNAVANNVHDSFYISQAAMALAYSHPATSAPDSIMVFSDYNNVATSTAFFSYPSSITIDSVYLIFTHEHNSTSADTIGYSIVSLNSTNGNPTLTSVLNSGFDTVKHTLSPGGNWLGQNATAELDFGPNYTTTSKTGVALTYKAPTTDSFGIIIDYVDNGSGGVANASTVPFCFYNYLPFIPNLSRGAGITSSGSPFYLQDWVTSVQVTFTEPLTGSFTYAPSAPRVGSSTTFTASSNSTSPTYSWNYGDGSSAGSGQISNHIYTAAGTYTVILTITDGSSSVQVSQSVVVLPTGINEIAAFIPGKIHPNPAKSGAELILPINLNTTANVANVKVFNAIGQVVAEENQGVSNEIKFNTSNLKSGIYFYSVEIGGQTANGKFTVVE